MRRLFLWTFFLGIVPDVGILLLQQEKLMPFLLYIGTGQVALLAGVGLRLQEQEMPMAIDTLHKAGFLHTLLAVGGAIVVSGQLISQESFTPQSLRLMLLPMGAALLPHALGLTAGHFLQIQQSTPDKEASIELEQLRKLQKQRVELLQQVVNSLGEEQTLHKERLTVVEKQLAQMKEATEALTKLKTSVEGVKREIDKLEPAVRVIRTTMESWSEASTKTTKGLGDAEKLYRSILALLESDLFRRAA